MPGLRTSIAASQQAGRTLAAGQKAQLGWYGRTYASSDGCQADARAIGKQCGDRCKQSAERRTGRNTKRPKRLWFLQATGSAVTNVYSSTCAVLSKYVSGCRAPYHGRRGARTNSIRQIAVYQICWISMHDCRVCWPLLQCRYGRKLLPSRVTHPGKHTGPDPSLARS
jgi:hypothetical protein